MEQFSRTRRLIGDAGISRLWDSKIVVFGVGGVGSHCIEALCRGGVGTLAIVDSDRVAVSNINRQSIASFSTVGRPKVTVMQEKLTDISPEAAVIPIESFVLPEHVDALFASLPFTPDYIVDAIDTVSAKLALAVYAKEHAIPIISSMGTGNKLHPEQFQITDIAQSQGCPLARVMRRELRARGIAHHMALWSPEPPATPLALEDPPPGRRSIPASVSWVPSCAGLMLAGFVVQSLLQAE